MREIKIGSIVMVKKSYYEKLTQDGLVNYTREYGCETPLIGRVNNILLDEEKAVVLFEQGIGFHNPLFGLDKNVIPFDELVKVSDPDAKYEPEKVVVYAKFEVTPDQAKLMFFQKAHVVLDNGRKKVVLESIGMRVIK